MRANSQSFMVALVAISGGLLGAGVLGAESSSGSSPPTDSVAQKQGEIGEIIVTAEKKEERLQDVPVPVSVLSADTLLEFNEVRLQDYYTSVPGLTVIPTNTGSPALTIRGITTNAYSNPTVGITVDDVPYGSSTNMGGGPLVPDLDPSDLARIEVLRGPQGTLYGASSIGGLLKFVTVDPTTDDVSGSVQAGMSSVRNGAELGYNVRGSVNIPLSDTFATRVSGFFRKDPGYIDNTLTGQKGVNEGESEGGRLSALWRPSQDVSMKFSALYQHSATDGSSAVGSLIGPDPNLGDLQQSDVKGTGGYDRKTQVYTAKLVAKIGAAELTSISGYSVNTFRDVEDFTTFFGSLNQAQFGVSGATLVDDNETKKFSQEIRLAMPLSQKIDWQFGLFYTDERSSYVQPILAVIPTTGAVVGIGLTESFPTTYREYAAFTDLTFHITDQFDIQVGGRESHNRQTYTELDTGPLVPASFAGLPSPLVFPLLVTNESASTFLLTPSFKLSTDLMVYARVASGFRPGGPNAEASAFGLPLSFNPDKTTNYELGVKGEAFGHALSFDGSIYYIDWKAIQLTVVAADGFSFFSNGSRAKSQGVELSVTARPLTGLSIAGWLEFNDAVLTEALPANGPTYGVPGDRLPYSSRFSGNVSIEQQFPITEHVSGFVGATESYVGARDDLFTGSAQRQHLPAYAKTDLRAGAKVNLWTANLFVTNATDKRGILTGGLGTNIPYGFEYITPRTIGLSLSRNF